MMRPRTFLATLAVLVAWRVLDYVLHEMILMKTYEETAQFWRTQEDMNRGLMFAASALTALCFTGIYAWFVGEKNVWSGLFYGLLYGIAAGASFGFVMYSVMDIPQSLGIAWFFGALVNALVGGAILGLVLQSRPATAGDGG